MARFYISSTFEDLRDHRRDVCKILRRRGHTVISMEDMGPTGRLPLDKCLEDVAKCDVYIGIIAWRYGFIPDGDKNPDGRSITECEYRHAEALKKKEEQQPEHSKKREILIFLLDLAEPWPETLREGPPGWQRVRDFRDYLSKENVVSLFRSRRDFRRKVRKAVRPYSHARSFREWLRDLLPDWPWYATAPAALAAALMLASLCVALYYWRLSPAERVEAKISYGIWPARSSGVPRDDFDFPPGVNSDTRQCAPPNQNLWDYPPDQWCITRDAYMLVKGPDWGVRKDLAGNEALYDFQATFTVEFVKGDDAAWVVRSQKDKRRGYVFKLQRELGEGDSIRLFLNGWVYTGGEEVALGKTPRNVLDIGRVYDGDFFEITLTAKDNAFSHQVRIQNVNARDPGRPFFNRPYPVLPMTDKDNHFPYGSIGFFAPEPGDEISVDDFALTVQSAPGATPF